VPLILSYAFQAKFGAYKMKAEPTGTSFWLVVEDDDDDFLLFRRACFLALDPPPTIHRETDGTSAKAFLSSSAQKPSLVISDLKMPQMTGLELLEWVRHQPDLQRLRFVPLSNSNADQDVDASRKLGADGYRVKPNGVRQFAQIVKEMSSYVDDTDLGSTPSPASK
jgi:CheY-like chemotaxis protein